MYEFKSVVTILFRLFQEKKSTGPTQESPLRILLFINDLLFINEHLTEKCKRAQNADDTQFCDDNNVDDVLQILQESCQKLSLYITRHFLKLNTSKNELIMFSKNILLKATIQSSVLF